MITRLYPAPQREVSLQGLYLQSVLDDMQKPGQPLVYTNFITSLDGRIAIDNPVTGRRGVPEMITNPRDWRLYQELAARADVVLVSGRYIRSLVKGQAQSGLPLSNEADYSDLVAWRLQQGLSRQPALVVLSTSLELPLPLLHALSDREVFVATGAKCASVSADTIRSIENSGVPVLIAGDDYKVDGRQLVKQLVERDFRFIYSIAGPGVLETLLRANVLDRMYITQVHRLIGGASFDTLLKGRLLIPVSDFILSELYYDDRDGQDCGQLFGIYQAWDDAMSVI